MIASVLALVGEQGYAHTTVAHVIAQAGASRKTFYECFADRQECFLAAAEEIVAQWTHEVAAAVARALAQADDALEAFASATFHQALQSPSALRLLTVELAATGPPGVERRERFMAELGATLSRALVATGSDDEDVVAPEDLLVAGALAGAIVRIPYSRALRGARVRRPRRAELLSLIPHVARWAASLWTAIDRTGIGSVDEPPPIGGRAPGTLSLDLGVDRPRGLPRGDSAMSRSFVVHSQRERLLDAVANLSAKNGYQNVTIPEIVSEAAVSAQAFYRHFSSREDALHVAYELGHRKALALVERAYRAQEDRRTATSAAIATLFGFLASEPSFAHLALIDVPAAGGKLMALAHEGALAYGELLKPRPGRSLNGRQFPRIAAEASANAICELCYAYAAAGRASQLSSLVDLATQIALKPLVPASRSGSWAHLS